MCWKEASSAFFLPGTSTRCHQGEPKAPEDGGRARLPSFPTGQRGRAWQGGRGQLDSLPQPHHTAKESVTPPWSDVNSWLSEVSLVSLFIRSTIIS